MTLGPEPIEDVKHPHVEGLNGFWLENKREKFMFVYQKDSF